MRAAADLIILSYLSYLSYLILLILLILSYLTYLTYLILSYLSYLTYLILSYLSYLILLIPIVAMGPIDRGCLGGVFGIRCARLGPLGGVLAALSAKGVPKKPQGDGNDRAHGYDRDKYDKIRYVR